MCVCVCAEVSVLARWQRVEQLVPERRSINETNSPTTEAVEIHLRDLFTNFTTDRSLFMMGGGLNILPAKIEPHVLFKDINRFRRILTTARCNALPSLSIQGPAHQVCPGLPDVVLRLWLAVAVLHFPLQPLALCAVARTCGRLQQTNQQTHQGTHFFSSTLFPTVYICVIWQGKILDADTVSLL